jgi:DNA invertase Pin-like site-specific DNA recombinase
MAPKAISYDRVSGLTQAKKGGGLQGQALDAETWAAQNGYELDTELRFRDAGKSASKGQHIAEGGAMRRLLDLAKAGQIEEGTVLIVEAIDRLSRIEPLDALLDILGPLVRAGLRIVTVEDGAVYDRKRIKEDSSALLVLVIKCQAAAEFAERLARRQRRRWVLDREKLREGKVARPHLFKCAWLDWDEEAQQFNLNSYAATARLALELLRDFGILGAARELNRRGLLSPSGKRWTGASVAQLLHSPSVEGAVVTNKSRRGAKARAAITERGLMEERFDGLLPPLMSAEEIAQIRAIVAGRANAEAGRGPTGETRFAGQGLVWCTCGHRAGVVSSNGKTRRHYYVRCRHRYSNQDGCRGHAFPLDALHGHVLSRLHAGELQQLLSIDTDRSSRCALEQKAVAELTGKLAVAEQELANATARRKAAIRAGDDDPIYAEAVADAREDVGRLTTALSTARGRLAALGQELSTGTVDADVTALMQAFSKGEDTAEMRQAVQVGLKRLGVRLQLDPEKVAVGISVAGSAARWQPFDPTVSKLALTTATTSAVFRDLTITEKSMRFLEALDPDDPGWAEWLRSMQGVALTSVTSLPPGWEQSAWAQAAKQAVADMPPEVREALKAMNEP